MKDLNVIGKMCMEDLEAIGYSFPKSITFKSSGRMKTTWGLCTTYRNKNYIEIKIANFLLQDDVREKELRQTIYHELAHAIDENKHGHSKEWKKIADTISDCYGVDIQQYCTKEEITALRSTEMYKSMTKKYSVVCLDCGHKTSRIGYRAPKWYSQVERYTCSRCHGKLKRAI